MARADLLALTDDGLVQLANAGLVKRGLKDLAAGAGPEIEEDGEGIVSARFADGVLTRLAPGRMLGDATCTCPASGMCRHRVLLALAYRARFAEAAEAPAEAWDPASIDPESFEATLPPPAKAELARLLEARIDIRLERGRVPAARLPMATVRFLTPNDLDYARCDCAVGLRCAHVALALRAFRDSEGKSEVSLGRDAAPAEAVGADALREALDRVVAHLLDVGVVAGSEAHAQTLDRARKASEAAGAVYATLALDALAEQIAAYEARSARYDELDLLALATELYARPRAADRSAALGLGEPFETAMGKTRLVSIGARLRSEGDDIRAAILVADSDTGAVMLLERLFSQAPGETARLAETVGRRLMAQGLPVSGTARGQILTSVGRRRADGLLTLGSGAGGRIALSPRGAVFAFRPPLAAESADALVERFAARPPDFLRPRRKVDDAHVFEVEAVIGQSWAPGEQLWRAALKLPGEGGVLHLERSYDAAAPGALDVLSAVFGGRFGEVRQVAGPVRVEAGELVLDPWSLGADSFLVPDLAAETAAGALALAAGAVPNASSIEQATRVLAGAVHAGRRARDALTTKAAGRIADDLSARGLRTTANRLRAFLSAGPTDLAPFGDAAAWLAALREETG